MTKLEQMQCHDEKKPWMKPKLIKLGNISTLVKTGGSKASLDMEGGGQGGGEEMMGTGGGGGP